jgi:hypothetical protein
MKKVLVALVLVSFVPAAFAAVFSDDMSTLDNWGQQSQVAEYGYGVGGIYLVDTDADTFDDAVQYNSWAAGAGWTNSWASAGTIADETDYTLTVRMISYVAGGQAVPISLQADWSVVVTDSPVVSDLDWADYSISLSTVGTANDSLIGKELGIGISPGWWNNLAVDQVTVVPEPTTMALLGLGGLLLRKRR